jgi:hypothetical protein
LSKHNRRERTAAAVEHEHRTAGSLFRNFSKGLIEHVQNGISRYVYMQADTITQ